MSDVTGVTVDELYDYVDVLAQQLIDSEEENRRLRRSIGAFKANSSRRRTRIETLQEQVESAREVTTRFWGQAESLKASVRAQKASIAAYKAAATRRAAARQAN